MFELIFNFYSDCFSIFVNCYNNLYGKKNITLEHCISDIILPEVFMDNKIYYGHNLKLLDCYRNRHITSVKKEMQTKYRDIHFVFVHESHVKFNFDISTIYVIYNNLNVIVDFKGIDHLKNDFANILHKKN